MNAAEERTGTTEFIGRSESARRMAGDSVLSNCVGRSALAFGLRGKVAREPRGLKEEDY